MATDMHYLISDLHLGHEEIIEVYNRPFASLDEMVDTIMNNWSATIDSDDSVIFLGDLGGPNATKENIWTWLAELGGIETIIRGNHEPFGHPDNIDTPLPLVERFEIVYNGYRFECTHKPYDLLDDFEGWGIHGHVHDGKLNRYPFLDPENRRINVSAEILHYQPISIEELSIHIEKGERHDYRPQEW